MKISLCLMTWNELEGCKIDVPNLPREAFDETFCIDGGSTDGTVEYLESQKIPVHKQPKKGLNAAYVHANDVATGDAVVVFSQKVQRLFLPCLSFAPYLSPALSMWLPVVRSQDLSMRKMPRGGAQENGLCGGSLSSL